MSHGLLSGVFWALDTVIISLFLLVLKLDIIYVPLVVTFLHDSFSAIWMIFYTVFKNSVKTVLDSRKNPGTKYIIFASLFGGPIGMSAYVLSIHFIGASLTGIITSIYPAVGALLGYLFLKEKRKPYQIVSLFISLGAVILLGYQSQDTISNLTLGIITAIVCVMAWALEAVICTYGMQKGELSNDTALLIRQTTSSLFFGIVVMNVISAYPISFELIQNPQFYLVAVAALFGTISYLFYYSSFGRVGASKTMSLNISYSAFAIVFSFLLLQQTPSLFQIGLGLVIILGGIISIYDFNESAS